MPKERARKQTVDAKKIDAKAEAGIFWDADTATPSDENKPTLKAVVGRLMELGNVYSSSITNFVAYKTTEFTPEGTVQEGKKNKAMRSLLKSLHVKLRYCLSATVSPFEDERDLDTKLAYDIYEYLESHPNAKAIIVATGDPGFVGGGWAGNCKRLLEERQGKLVIVAARNAYLFNGWADDIYRWQGYAEPATETSTNDGRAGNGATDAGINRTHASVQSEDRSNVKKKSKKKVSTRPKHQDGLSVKRSSSGGSEEARGAHYNGTQQQRSEEIRPEAPPVRSAKRRRVGEARKGGAK